ncbi:MAG: hypothetical protein HYY01_11515 [Chloroflexi bacterium]|nr:hypothetical protein [Chloroflexota bacterium]
MALIPEWPFPRCQQCQVGELVPLSDYGPESAPIRYKAWVCTNPDCEFNIEIRKGQVWVNMPVTDHASPG